MKKQLLLLAAFFAITGAFAQSQRIVLFEQFTQASCGPCAATNPILNAMLDGIQNKVVSIKYQTSWPGTDPMNAQNPTQVATRVSYYNVTGVPDGELDGGIGFSGQPAGMTQANVNTRYAVPAPFTIGVNFYLNSAKDSIFCHAHILCTQAVTGTSLVAHMAIIERNIYFTTAPGSNGEKQFEGVMKKMLPSDQGTTVPNAWAVGDSLDLNYSWALANVYDKNQLAVVAFIQDNSTKNVLQAGYLSPRIQYDAEVRAISGNAIQCTPTVNPTVTIFNNAIDPLTTCDINYTVDGVAGTTINWTGNVPQYGSSTVIIPTQTFGNGSHKIIATSSNPNGNADMDTHNDSYTRSYGIFISAVSAPLIENFASATYPNNGFAVENVDNDAYTWIRSPYGFSGAGCSKASCYYSDPGTIDNLYAPKVNFTYAITGSNLTFDVAYAMYAAAYSDRLKVNVSSNCGASWTNIYNKAGTALTTNGGAFVTGVFAPSGTQWRHETISLDQFNGIPELLVQFSSVSANGNNIYIDNVNISDGTLAVPVVFESSSVEVYPNPAKSEAYLKMNFDKASDLNVEIYNSLGAKVYASKYESFSTGTIKLDVSGLSVGNYVVKVNSVNGSISKRLTISE